MRKVLVQISRERDWRIERQAVRAHRFYLLKGREDFELGEAVCLLLAGPNKRTVSFDARVLYVNPERGVGLEIADGEGSDLCKAPKASQSVHFLEAGPDDEPQPASESPAPETTAPKPAPDAIPDAKETSNPPSQRAPDPGPGDAANAALLNIKRLGPTARRRLALVGNRLERSILFQDPLRDVQSFVLLNPKLGVEDVMEYSLFPQLTPSAVAMILENATWMKDPHVRFHLAKNPSVPKRVGHDLLAHLEPAQIRHVAKSDEARDDVRQVAQALVDKHSKKWT